MAASGCLDSVIQSRGSVTLNILPDVFELIDIKELVTVDNPECDVILPEPKMSRRQRSASEFIFAIPFSPLSQ